MANNKLIIVTAIIVIIIVIGALMYQPKASDTKAPLSNLQEGINQQQPETAPEPEPSTPQTQVVVSHFNEPTIVLTGPYFQTFGDKVNTAEAANTFFSSLPPAPCNKNEKLFEYKITGAAYYKNKYKISWAAINNQIQEFKVALKSTGEVITYCIYAYDQPKQLQAGIGTDRYTPAVFPSELD